MLNQLIQFWLSVFPLKFIQKIHRLEWIEVRLKFLPFAYKLCCYFSFFTWQHCQGLWEEEFSLLSGHNVRLFMSILSFIFFLVAKEFGSWESMLTECSEMTLRAAAFGCLGREETCYSLTFSTCVQIQE